MSAGYIATVPEFFEDDVDRVVGLLARAVADTGMTSQYSRQITVWKDQVNILKDSLRRLSVEDADNLNNWHIALEYELPRRQKRPDAILLAGDRVLVIEFKFGMQSFELSARWQAEDYALNLRDFHAASHGRCIVPILCAVDAPDHKPVAPQTNGSIVSQTLLDNGDNLWLVLQRACGNGLPPKAFAHPIDTTAWLASPYRPTLTIIEAAERLYGNHSVREISHSYADNLDKTTEMLADVIQDAKRNKKRCICFVTGVPGSGKTLTGLNVVHDPAIRSKQGPSGIFLSGNGPLVKSCAMRWSSTNNELDVDARRPNTRFRPSSRTFTNSCAITANILLPCPMNMSWCSTKPNGLGTENRCDVSRGLSAQNRPSSWR